MGNKHVVDSGEAAEQNHISKEEAETLIAAFKDGNKKAKPVNLKKFRRIMADVYKVHDNEIFSPDAVDLCFQLFDSQHDGKIDQQEFLAGIATLTAGTTEQKAELVFHAIDYTNSGKITKRALCDYVEKTIRSARGLYSSKLRDDGLNVALRLGLIATLSAAAPEIVDEIVKQVFEGEEASPLTLEQWLEAAKEEGSAVARFLNPSEQLHEEVKVLKDKAEESGLITKKEDYDELKTGLLSDLTK